MKNREIKFRAWYPKEKIIVDDVPVYKGVAYVLDNLLDKTQPWFVEDSIVMQFTGLKDKNGKEIYESDVVVCDKDGFKGVIEYEQQNAGFWLYSGDEKYYRELHLLGAYGDENGLFIDAEVIGNIYENPELVS